MLIPITLESEAKWHILAEQLIGTPQPSIRENRSKCKKNRRWAAIMGCTEQGKERNRNNPVAQKWCLRTSVEPEQERLLLRLPLGLEEPVEERLAAAARADVDVAGVMPEPDRRLPGQPGHEVGLRPRAPPWRAAGRTRRRGQREHEHRHDRSHRHGRFLQASAGVICTPARSRDEEEA